MDRRRFLTLATIGAAVAVERLSTDPISALAACAPSQPSKVDGQPNIANCDREVRIAYLAGVYKPGESQIIAALTDRTVEVVIEGINPIKVKVGNSNNSGVAEDAAAAYRRSLVVGGLTLNYIAVPVGQRAAVTVGIHRLNINGTRRTSEASNPPYQPVDTCLVEGGLDMHTPTGLRTIQVFAQDSRLGNEPGDYTNSKNDLVFQDPSKLFQGVELGYLIAR